MIRKLFVLVLVFLLVPSIALADITQTSGFNFLDWISNIFNYNPFATVYNCRLDSDCCSGNAGKYVDCRGTQSGSTIRYDCYIRSSSASGYTFCSSGGGGVPTTTTTTTTGGGGGGCNSDSQCPSSKYCQYSTCLDDKPNGQSCNRNAECINNACNQNVCSLFTTTVPTTTTTTPQFQVTCPLSGIQGAPNNAFPLGKFVCLPSSSTGSSFTPGRIYQCVQYSPSLDVAGSGNLCFTSTNSCLKVINSCNYGCTNEYKLLDSASESSCKSSLSNACILVGDKKNAHCEGGVYSYDLCVEASPGVLLWSDKDELCPSGQLCQSYSSGTIGSVLVPPGCYDIGDVNPETCSQLSQSLCNTEFCNWNPSTSKCVARSDKQICEGFTKQVDDYLGIGNCNISKIIMIVGIILLVFLLLMVIASV